MMTPISGKPDPKQMQWISPSSQESARSIQIAVIDNFNPVLPEEAATSADMYFNHGETVCNMLLSGGADPSLQSRIALSKWNVGAPAGQMPDEVDAWVAEIAAALAEVLSLVEKQPDSVDVVCLAQQCPMETTHTVQVRELMNQLMALGVPVVVAAGNQSDCYAGCADVTPNYLAPSEAFIVQATQHGNLLNSSKPGNVSAEGRSTSFSAPAIVPLAGDYKVLGLDVNTIRQKMQARQAFHHGTFPAAIAQNAYSGQPTVPLGRQLAEVAV